MSTIYTVSQVNGYLKELLDEEVQLKSVFIRGEVSNFVHHMKTGHFYFTLKDSKTSIKAIMFKWNAAHIQFLPQNGMNVLVFGSVQLFERDGICQINCTDMQPDGVGALYMAFEQLKQKLAQEGIFDPDHKRPLPPFPRRIGVVTSKDGAALQDIRQILSRRYPLVELVVIPAQVQGEKAPQSIRQGIVLAQKAGLDLLIVGRGGGALEDLWAFNDEEVAKAIYHSQVPVISAVGHEVDVTIADLAADLRAPTPSAAAELAVPDRNTLLSGLAGLRSRMGQAISRQMETKRVEVQALFGALVKNSPENRCVFLTRQLKELQRRLSEQGKLALERPLAALRRQEAALEALSPLRVLRRGYATVFAREKVISSIKELTVGQQITIRLADGRAKAEVQAILPERDLP